MSKLKCASLWSGGKDSCYACYKAKQNGNDIRYLLNFTYIDPQGASAHGLAPAIVQDQANSIGIPLIQCTTTRENYEHNFRQIVNKLKEEAIEGIIFGDIYLQEHRNWIESICQQLKVKSIFPLWDKDANELLYEFITLGFKAVIVSVRQDILGKEWLGKPLDKNFIAELKEFNRAIDPCGENGEFHTLVISGPNFRNRIEIIETKIVSKMNHWNLDILRWVGL